MLSALNAGARWESIGDVLDAQIVLLRSDVRQWVQNQRALHDAMEKERRGSTPIGMSAAHAEAATALAEVSNRQRHEPGRE